MASNKKLINQLIESLKQGQYENPLEKISALAAALSEEGIEPERIIALLKAPQPALRLAAIQACRNRKEEALLNELKNLAGDAEQRVRFKLAETLNHVPLKGFRNTISILAKDEDEEVRQLAIKATSGIVTYFNLQKETLLSDSDYDVRLAAANALNAQELNQADLVKAFLDALERDDDSDVQFACAKAIEKRFSKNPSKVEKLLPADIRTIEILKNKIGSFKDGSCPKLAKWLSDKSMIEVNLDELRAYGTDLTEQALQEKLPRAYDVGDTVEKLISVIQSDEKRSAVLLGESGVGKSAIVNELVHELARPERGGWRVLRMTPTEFMSGTRFLGEWETKVKNLVEAIRHPRKVVIYVPSLGDLTAMGKWDKSDANVASSLAPYIEDGSIVMIGESTPTEYDAGMGSTPSLNRLFERIMVEEASVDDTRAILTSIRNERQLSVSNEMIEELLEISGQYLNHTARPGNAAALLQELSKTEGTNGAREITQRTILTSISKSTGIPVDFLDDSIPLNLEDVRAYFEGRVMGQQEAVDSVVDLITLIKAGLTDANKPFGVFLFVGPTGVGKTELARALAGFVFSDESRLLRFDMSEYASYDAFERLIGAGYKQGLLTQAVKRQPFSVVLFDEIEKAHMNVFDLFLQLFDDGRLTDGRGQSVNFRRTILVLTSNIGATTSGTIEGFSAQARTQSKDSGKEKTFRELSRFFRPEFLNRIDRIINFRPLSLEVTENIARREVNNVLSRSGIARRHLSVDIDSSVISLLVKEGYSSTFGARPLKRAVESVLLLPLARAISTGRISGKTVLQLTATGDKVTVNIVKSPEKKPVQNRKSTSLLARSDELLKGINQLEDKIEILSDRKSDLVHQINDPDFYRDEQKKSKTFGELHRLEQFLSAYDGICKVITGIQNRLTRKVDKRDEGPLLERINQLAGELEHLSFVATSSDAADLGDAVIRVKLVDHTGKRLEGVETLASMYAAFARRRRLTAEVVSEYQTSKEDCLYLQITGLGAYAMFKCETGLHQLENRKKVKSSRNGKEKQIVDSEILRVDVYPDSQPDRVFVSRLKSNINRSKEKALRYIDKPCYLVSLFHEPSLRSFQGCLAGKKDEALSMAQLLLFSEVNADGDSKDSIESSIADRMVRQYDLGIGARVKDGVTGKSTTRVNQVLKGQLDLLK